MTGIFKNSKTSPFTIIAGLLLVIFFFIFYLPRVNRVFSTKIQISELEGKIDAANAHVKKGADLNNILADMQRQLYQFENRLPAREQIASVISELANIARASSVEVVGIRPSEPEVFTGVDKLPLSFGDKQLKVIRIELKLRASYKSIADYIKNIQESVNILATMDEINISRTAAQSKQLNATVIFLVFLS